MTKDEILALTAGEALDALVAERVMSLVPGTDFGAWPDHAITVVAEDFFVGVVPKFSEDPKCDRCGKFQFYLASYEPGRPCVKLPPPYSTSVACAWLVVEKFETVTATKIDGQWLVTIKIGATGKTFPEAVCKAALLATRQETP